VANRKGTADRDSAAGQTSIHWPGSYEIALQQVAFEQAHGEALARHRTPGLMTSGPDQDAARLELFARQAELAGRSRGGPVLCRRHQLNGRWQSYAAQVVNPAPRPVLPASMSGKQVFIVTVDDVIRVRAVTRTDR
jgi:hypothetical protein